LAAGAAGAEDAAGVEAVEPLSPPFLLRTKNHKTAKTAPKNKRLSRTRTNMASDLLAAYHRASF